MNSGKSPISKSAPIKVGITMGDPSGIGPSIIAKALAKIGSLAEFYVIGDRGVFKKIPNSRFQIPKYNFIDLNNINHKNFKFGKIRAEYGRASIEYLDKALELIKNKKIDCLVTCPISKEAINLAGFPYAGHTEYFAQKTRAKGPVMMLLNKKLKISLVTRHLPLKEVPAQLNEGKIYKTILLTYRSLRELFLIDNPRLVVCGLNPHASDNALIGQEEKRVIRPALRKLSKIITHLDGPISCDVAITKAYSKEYDCVIAMYHDQALIPLKLTAKETGVNLTLGLPFIRTSPLHGTAFDIAGTGRALPASLIEAIKLAIRCTLNQRRD
jgi:4-hydroxythreonine-4-phosphate dehydrogenase